MRFSFWYGGFDDADQEWLEEAITLIRNNKWQSSSPLYFDGLRWQETIRAKAALDLLVALKRNTSVRSLYLRNASLTSAVDQALNDVLSCNDHLTSITLKKILKGTDILIAPATLFSRPYLRNLSLEACTIDIDGTLALAHTIGNKATFQSLSLDNVHLSAGWDPINQAISKSSSLRYLSLKNMRFTVLELHSLLRAISINCSLVSLYLENAGIDENYAESLTQLFDVNRALQVLSLRKNSLTSAAAVSMAKALGHNNVLQTLLLSNNPLGSLGAVALVDALNQNASLTRLCLANCDISKDGCCEVAKKIGKIKVLRALNLDGNDVECSAAELLNCLRSNALLTEILDRLPANCEEKGKQVWKQIDFYLRWNKAGRCILQEPNVWCLMPMALSKASVTPDITFAFLANHQF